MNALSPAAKERDKQRRREYSRRYRLLHPEKTKAEKLRWLAEHPEQRREYIRAANIKIRYGVTRDHHRAMYEAQNYRCAVCGIEQGKVKFRFCIDHNHKTKVVRGLLCRPCNSLIGHAYENIEVLKAAVAYLEKHAGL